MTISLLAQNSPQGGNGGGGGSNMIVSIISGLENNIIPVCLALASLLLLVALTRVMMTVRSGGSFGEAFSSVGLILVGVVGLGLGGPLIQAMFDLGKSVG